MSTFRLLTDNNSSNQKRPLFLFLKYEIKATFFIIAVKSKRRMSLDYPTTASSVGNQRKYNLKITGM